ncbi:hypothetical protein [Micromonospora sp. KC723]|uniref:hypothetical protein n=1 Tax=Micromonospora sp. KC723 TaxID=2530381 RepID=UPI00140455FC|nr:hypothetical protein [Micromonospora sp. KC723]
MTTPHSASGARPDAGLVNRRHDPGRYRTLDRNSDPAHLFPNLDHPPVNRPSHRMEGTR